MPARSPSSARPAEPSLAEHACLALVVEGVTHGWAVGSVLAPDGELGRIWSLSRPLTYRALDALVEKGLVTPTGTAPGRGRDRRTLAATAAGRRAARRWLDRPVAHLRDVRTELLLKVELRRRAGMAVEPLLRAQSDALAEVLDALDTEPEPGDLVALWRRESARAVRRFLRAALAPEQVPAPPRADLRLSARNQLHATVTRITRGDVLCSVRAALPDGQSVTATITTEAADDLGLAEGDPVVMIAKATETMVATPPPPAAH